MKLYRESPHVSMSMEASDRLRTLLEDTLREMRTTHVVETGTYRGLGSTTFVAEAFPDEAPPERFMTIEANWESWLLACYNLRRFPFIEPVLGKTVPQDRALAFMAEDEFLHNHHEHPDIYIDDVVNPVRFYTD